MKMEMSTNKKYRVLCFAGQVLPRIDMGVSEIPKTFCVHKGDEFQHICKYCDGNLEFLTDENK